jgi:hypothetical protein
MSERILESPLSALAPDEIATPVMVYTQNALSWGQLITKKAIRAGIILRSTVLPDYLSIYQAHLMNLQGREIVKPVAFNELHFSIEQIIGFHVMPPNEEPPDYDPDEPNRKMEPITVLVGKFFFHGHVRISDQTNLKTFLDVTKIEFTSMYDVDIAHVSNAGMKPIHVPMCQVRRQAVIFGSRV